MRNLKRVLSLTLASVMLLGMMVVGSSAAGYSDVDEEDNVEAIEVLQAVEVMVGDDRGFGPDRPVTRNEMAVVMGKLLNLDYNYYTSTCPFNDVANWARGWVGACAANGIVSGRGNGVYDGESTVTAIEAASMMMRALGYFKNLEDYADGFQVVTVRQGSQIGIFEGVGTDANTPMTRNQVAQMALNALRSEMVDFTGTPGIEVNGVKVGYRAEYTPRTSTELKYNAIEGRTSDVASDANHKGQYYIQLGEQLYDGKLRLNNDAEDVFGRPSRYWEYSGKEIGTYAKYEMMVGEYTKKVTGDDLYDLLTRNTVINYDVDLFIDGEITAPTGATASWWFTKTAINRNNDATVGGTGNGVLTQVFVNDDDKVVTISIINTYLAIASDDYNTKKEEAPFNVYGIGKTGTGNIYFKQVRDANDDGKPMTAHSEDFDVANIKKDDAVLVTVADSEIQTLVPAEVLAGTEIQAFETGYNINNAGTGYVSDAPGNVVVDGTQYDFASAAEYDYEVMQDYTTVNGVVNLKDKTYNVYLDKYGYAIGVKELEAAKNYVFITAVDTNNSNRYTRSADATAIFLDGTMADIKIDMTKSTWQSIEYTKDDSILNTWCTYTVNTDNVYTVKEVSNVTKGSDKNGANSFNYVPKGSANDSGNGKLAQYQYNVANGAPEDPIKIDRKNITVAGYVAPDLTARPSADAYKRVYGTDKSVYLTVELSELKNDGTVYGIIGDVVSATTGIDNVALEVWNTTDVLTNGEDKTVDSGGDGNKTNDLTTTTIANVSNGVYTLYNDKGDIIAAVVVGEDSGATKNLVYTHEGATFKEAYDKATGKWTWQRKVVFNGEEIILTEVGDGLSELGRMKKSTWYQVKYNSDGNVIDVTEYDQVSSMTAGEDYVTSYTNDEIVTAVNKKDTVLFHSVGEKVNTANLKLEERTLWLDGLKTKGFRVAEDVKIVLIQNNHNVEKTYFESGISSLRSIISDLNDRHTSVAHDYIISAILDRNAATSLIIRDIDDTGATNCDPYTDPSWSGSDGNMAAGITGDVITITGYVAQPVDQISNTIVKKLQSEGYTDIEVEVANGMISGVVAKKNSTKYNFTVSGVPSAASVKAALDAKAAGLAATLNVPGKDPVHNETTALAAIKALEVTAVNDASITVDVALKSGESFSAATNGVVSPGNTTGTDGTGFKCIVTLSKNGQSATAEVTVTMKALAYANTNAGIANTRIANAKTAIGTITLNATANANADNKAKAIALVQAAANAKLQAAATDVTGVTVTVAAGTTDSFTAPTDGVGTTGTAGTNGTVTVKITISCPNGTDDVQDNVAIAIPAVAAP